MTAVRTSLVARPEGAISAPAPIESALVTRAQKGDGRAFRLIFERNAGPVRRFLRDLLGDDSAADEAMQETFVRAHGRLGTLRDSDKLQSWLLGIARLVSLEQLRGRRRHADEEAADEPVDEAPTPELALLGQEADRKLGEALEQLSEQRRAALLLRLDHNLGYDEIAEIMGWPLSKVKNEIHRARLQLRQFLSRYVSVRSG